MTAWSETVRFVSEEFEYFSRRNRSIDVLPFLYAYNFLPPQFSSQTLGVYFFYCAYFMQLLVKIKMISDSVEKLWRICGADAGFGERRFGELCAEGRPFQGFQGIYC